MDNIGNLTRIMDSNMAWSIMEHQNLEYLGETWNQTADKIALEGEDIYLQKLGIHLAEWVEEEMQNQTELWYSIQAVGTDIRHLGKIIIQEFGMDIPKEHIGWAWHLLHTEQ